MEARLHRTLATACAAAAGALALGACAPPAQASNLQAELFQKQYSGARADGVRAAGRVPLLGVLELGYTRTLGDSSPDPSHAAAIEWRPPGMRSSGFNVRATEQRDGALRTRAYQVGWTLRF